MKKDDLQQQDEVDEQITDLSIYIAALGRTFAPAKTFKDTTHWFTTEEICNSIKSLNPSEHFKKGDLVEALKSNGYIFSTKPGGQSIQFYWLLKSKE